MSQITSSFGFLPAGYRQSAGREHPHQLRGEPADRLQEVQAAHSGGVQVRSELHGGIGQGVQFRHQPQAQPGQVGVSES